MRRPNWTKGHQLRNGKTPPAYYWKFQAAATFRNSWVKQNKIGVKPVAYCLFVLHLRQFRMGKWFCRNLGLRQYYLLYYVVCLLLYYYIWNIVYKGTCRDVSIEMGKLVGHYGSVCFWDIQENTLKKVFCESVDLFGQITDF